MADFAFWLIAALTLGSALMVVSSKSLLYSAYSLLFTFIGVTGLYVFLWADFLAVVQVVVYVGGILEFLQHKLRPEPRQESQPRGRHRDPLLL